MYDRGIDIGRSPPMDGRDPWLASMSHIAVAGRCFDLSCDQFSLRSGHPAEYANVFGDDPSTVISKAGSSIVDPSGEFPAEPSLEGEAALTGEIDGSAIARGKHDFNVTGHYARPDAVRLIVDERRKLPAVRLSDRALTTTACGIEQ